jgi:hypothetical protein
MKEKYIMNKRNLFVGVFVMLMLSMSSLVTTSGVAQRTGGGDQPHLQLLAQVQARHEASIMRLPGVVGMGIAIRGQQLVHLVLVDENASMPALPSSLEGTLVVAERTPPIVVHNGGDGCNPCHASQQPLPAPMGVSTSNNQGCFAGTLGFKACDSAAQIIGYVTNNHVAAASGSNLCENGSPGLTELHRGTFDAGCLNTQVIGTLQKRVTLQFPGPNQVDAAFVKSDASQTSASILDVGTPSTTPGTPTLNLCVQKSGRTTGVTFGVIDAVNVTANVGGYCGGTAQFQQLVRYAPSSNCGSCANPPCSSMSAPGDSGSPVLDLSNNIVALNFAGDGTNGFGATIQNVLSQLSLTLDLNACSGGGGGGGGGGGCPAQTAVQGTPTADSTLGTLYQLRDNVLANSLRGQRYIQLYYANSSEATSMMLTNWSLLMRTQELLDHFMPVIRSVASKKQVALPRTDVDQIDQLLADMAAKSSTRMQVAIQEVRRDLQSSRVLAQFGIRVAE